MAKIKERYSFIILILAVVGLLTISSRLVFAAPGDLDSTFGTGGLVTTSLNDYEIGKSIAIQPDGKILVAGDSYNGVDFDFALARYETDGTLDLTFGNSGWVTTTFGTETEFTLEILVQPDGKILVAGVAQMGSNLNDFALARYESNGSLDMTFGSGGLVTTHFGVAGDSAYGLALQPDGKIVLVGRADNGSDDDLALARYEADGSLDITFGSGGLVTTDFDGFDDEGESVVLQEDGKILVAGTSGNGPILKDFALARYESDGSLDMTFGSGGLVTTDFFGGGDYGQSIALRPGGKIVVGGFAGNRYALAQYEMNGSLDGAFSNDGKATASYNNSSHYGRDIAIQSDGKVVIAGQIGSNFGLMRFRINGTLDAAFGTGGIVLTNFGDIEAGSGVALQSDGRILVAGSTRNGLVTKFALARYEGGGNLSPVAVNDGFVTDEDTAFTTGNVLDNDYDPDFDPISFVSSTITSTTGLVTSNGDGTFDYDPYGQFDYLAVGETAVDTFGYTISDTQNLTATAMISVTVEGVNDLPVAGDDTAKTLEDTPTVIDVLGNDSDIDLSDVLMVTALADPANGIVATNGISLTYTPTLNFNGLDVFTYTVGDGNGGGAMATVTVTVNAVNDPPVAVDDGFVTDENTAFVTGNVLENDYDPDNETVSFAGLSTTGTAGLVTSNGDGTFDYDPNGQFDYLAVGETAVDTFGYTISDTQNLTATAIVSITIEGVNDLPVAGDDTAETLEDTATVIDALGNDMDIDSSDVLMVTAVANPTNGIVATNGISITYTPTLNFNGLDVFTYTVGDGNGGFDTATVTVTVEAVNDPPVAGDDLALTRAGVAVLVDVLSNDDDPVDGDMLVITAVDDPLNGTAVIVGSEILYTPDANFVGLEQFTYTISDGEYFVTATITVTVEPHLWYFAVVIKS
jgi:uncharacterized delta-60 repeat protein